MSSHGSTATPGFALSEGQLSINAFDAGHDRFVSVDRRQCGSLV